MAFITRLQRVGVSDAKKGNREKTVQGQREPQRPMPEDTVSARKESLLRVAGSPRVGKGW